MEPKLRFKEFSGDWEEIYFKDSIFIKNGLVSPDDYPNLPHIGPGNMEKETGRLLDYNLAKDDNLISSKYLFTKDEIIYGKINPHFAKVVFPKFEGLCSADTYPIKANNNYIVTEFLFYILLGKEFTKFATSVSKRTGMPKINREDLLRYSCKVPPLPEQTKIADFLSTVDDKIQNQQNKITHLENIKKGFMQKIFSRKIRFKDDEGNEFPEWEEKKLKDFCQYQSSSVSTSMILENGNYELFDANGKIGYTDSFCNKKYISIIKDGAGVGRIRLLPKNSFCISTMGIITSNKYSVIEYLYYIMSQLVFTKYIVGATIPHIYFKDYGCEKIELPCLEEQQKIADFLSSFDEKIDAEKETLEHLKELKNGLLQQMFV